MLAVTYTAMFAVRHRARSFLGRDRMQGAGPLKTRSVTTMAQKVWPHVCRNEEGGPGDVSATGNRQPSIFLRNQDPQDDVNDDTGERRRENRHQYIDDPRESGVDAEVVGETADHAGDHAVATGATKRA